MTNKKKVDRIVHESLLESLEQVEDEIADKVALRLKLEKDKSAQTSVAKTESPAGKVFDAKAGP